MRVPYTRAIRFIESHGFAAALTLDGLVMNVPCAFERAPVQATFETETEALGRAAGLCEEIRFTDDVCFDETLVIDVAADGTCEARHVRDALGY